MRAIVLTICAALLLLVVDARVAWAQEKVETLCVSASSQQRTLTNGASKSDHDDPEPTLCDQRHWQTVMIFTGFVTTGFAVTAAQSMLSGERLTRRASVAMFVAAAPQAIFGATFLAQDLSDGSIDFRDVLLLGSTVVSSFVAAYSGWSLLRPGRERQQARVPAIRVGAAPTRHGLVLGASGQF